VSGGVFDPGSRLRGVLSLVGDKVMPGRGATSANPGGTEARITVGPAIDARISDARLRALLAYWRDKSGQRGMPARRDLDPADFTPLLGGVALVDVLHDPLRFRYRLVGTHIVERLGREMTGQFVSEIPRPQLRHATMKDYELVVHQRAAVLDQGDEIYDGRRFRYEILRLPLAADGVLVNMILTAAVYGED
jgi:hypothetical protein